MPSGPPRSVTVRVISSTAIDISWTPPLPSEQNGIIRGYTVSVTSVDQALQFNIQNTSLVVAGLHPFTDYTVSVVAVTVGPGVVAQGQSIRTYEDGEPFVTQESC